jgi:putative protease
MTVSDGDAARFAASLGCTRLVAPRELSVEEIRVLTKDSPVDVEVFIHGALCVSWSGQCLTSEAWGGRSANRGQCAQSCRMPYDLVLDGTVRDTHDVKYLLSPKDLAGARAVPALRDAGVASLKIEGRQKGPQYVSTAVTGYRRWVDAVVRGDAEAPESVERWNSDLRDMTLCVHARLVGRLPRGFGPPNVGRRSISEAPGRLRRHGDARRREGSRGHAAGRRTPLDGRPHRRRAPNGTERPGRGPAAPDSEAATMRRPDPPSRLSRSSRAWASCSTTETRRTSANPAARFSGVDRRGEFLGARIRRSGADLTRVRPGQRVWVTQDPALVRATEKVVVDAAPEGRLGVALRVEGAVGLPLRVTATHGTHRVSIESAMPLAASERGGLTAELLEDKLGSFGGTRGASTPSTSRVFRQDSIFPVSELKRLRRTCVADLEAAWETGRSHPCASEPVWPTLVGADLGAFRGDTGRLRVVPLCREIAHIEAALDADCREVELDWMELVGLGKAVAFAKDHGLDVHLATLRVTKPGEAPIDARLADLAPAGYLVRHWGGMMRLRRDPCRCTAISR